MRIVSLTTIPPRFPYLGATLASLLAQDIRIDAIELAIPRWYHRFPGHDGSLPDLPEGITLLRPDTDYGPATKLLPSLHRHAARPQTQILYCDDDRVFDKRWARRMFRAQSRRPQDAVSGRGYQLGETDTPAPQFSRNRRKDWRYHLPCLKHTLQFGNARAREMRHQIKMPPQPGYADIATGFTGVVVRPAFFDDRVFEVPSEAFYVDDIWLSACLAANGVRIWCPGLPLPPKSQGDLVEPLLLAEFDSMGRAALNARAIVLAHERFGIWPHARAVQEMRARESAQSGQITSAGV